MRRNGKYHNVKGHGLRLAYVKKMVSFTADKFGQKRLAGKGSTFFIKIPLKS